MTRASSVGLTLPPSGLGNLLDCPWPVLNAFPVSSSGCRPNVDCPYHCLADGSEPFLELISGGFTGPPCTVPYVAKGAILQLFQNYGAHGHVVLSVLLFCCFREAQRRGNSRNKHILQGMGE